MAAILQIQPVTGVPATARVSADPRDPSFFADPYAFYETLYGDRPGLFWEQYGHWCFADFTTVNALLRDKRFGRDILHVATREEIGLPEPKPHTADFDFTERFSLLNLEAPKHTRMRALVNRAFVSRNVESLRPRIAALANELIDSFEDKGEVELLKAFAAPVPAIVIAEMLGLPVDMAGQLVAWSNRMVAMYMYGVTEATERDANAAATEFVAYLREVIAERRVKPGTDLMTHLLGAEIDGEKLSENEIISTAVLLLNAGHEATVHTTGNGVKSILESGLDPATLFADDRQTAATIEECVRFDAPLHMFTRYALDAVQLTEDIHLRKGDVVGLMLGAANRDPARFADPNRFDPFRPDNANVSFGAGIHFCIGATLARIEMQESMKALFHRLPNLRLAAKSEYANVYHFHGLTALQVQW